LEDHIIDVSIKSGMKNTSINNHDLSHSVQDALVSTPGNKGRITITDTAKT
jgi:hypothetical protein